MARSASEESGDLRSFNVISSGQESFATGEALAEWRSSEQLENGTPSTSPPFWDTDDDDDCGPRPSELYGKYTWKIDKFSQINKRELRSKAFEVGGYKWYILIYPQGCDVCNHLSLFLCVANHDKLLPGWSHFAQFTIAVVNKDPKKSKYSDTLHRFWKKEHDWGWKKFMELSKVLDGFIDADTLIIKAQVQVLRERADRPFRCLDCQYRRELVRVYLTNVEQICRRFVEERRSKLGKLVEDKAKWSSFCAFWLGIDQKSRHGMSREKTDAVLRVVVKQFFIEKEVTSTLVMDSLYSGLKALEGHSKKDMCRAQLLDVEDLPVPIVCIEQDMFVLADDVLLLLERAALEPLPPKDDKGPQTRMKDGSLGEEFNKDSIERDERRLTELGRRTIEIFVLAHIFSKIEVAYQEAVALKRQEELIREEAAWLAVSEQKSKRGVADKEKKSKKKQGKQKRNNRKGKDKGRCENPIVEALDKLQLGGPNGDKDPTKHETFEDVSDVSDSVDRVIEVLQPDSEERESSPVNWDTDASEVRPLTEGSSHGASAISAEQNEIRESNSLCTVDDSSSTCSTDSVPSVVMDGYNKVNLSSNQESDRSPTRGRIQQGRAASDAPGSANEVNARPPDARRDVGPPNGSSNQVNSGLADARKDVGPPNGSSASCKFGSEPETFVEPLLVNRKKVEHTVKGEASHLTGPSIKDQVDTHRPSKEKTTLAPPSPPSSSFKHTPPVQLKPELKTNLNSSTANVSLRRQSFDTTQLASSVTDSAEIAASSRSEIHRSPPKLTEKPLMQELPVISRPLSAPVVPGPRPNTPVASIIQNQPIPSHSITSWVGHDPTPVNLHQSYRTAIMGTMHNPPSSSSSGFTQAMHKLPTSSSSGFTQPQSPNTVLNLLQPYGQPAGLMYPPMPMFPSRSSERVEPTMVKCSPSFGIINPSVQNDINTHDLFKNNTSIDPFPSESTACTSGRQSHGVLTDEFPHLDIINDLLEDEHGVVNVGSRTSTSFQSPNKGFHHLNRQFSFPGDICMSNDLVGPSTSSSRFERTRSYKENGFQHGYGSIGSPFEHIHEFFPQPNLRPYGNGQIDALIPNQWQVSGSDLSYLSARTTEGVGHPYHIPDYSNLGCGSNGYAVFRPSNGH